MNLLVKIAPEDDLPRNLILCFHGPKQPTLILLSFILFWYFLLYKYLTPLYRFSFVELQLEKLR